MHEDLILSQTFSLNPIWFPKKHKFKLVSDKFTLETN